jgi:NAD(P)H-hydrate epimerase
VDRIGKPMVLTPHPGEMARLAGLPSAADVQGNRVKTAMLFAQRYELVVVLKGHGTIVSDGNNMFINPTGNAGMATAGAGDVLTGVIAALIGQGLSAFDASVLGVYVHGLAGDLAAQQKGQVSLIATDLIDLLPDAFLQLEKVDYQVPLPG